MDKNALKFKHQRERMVKEQIGARGISDVKVLDAMRRVPRHLFVSEALMDQAYGDYPLPIGEQQTISQPYIVAEMTQALELGKDDRVLEIGTGSGYQAAILAELVRATMQGLRRMNPEWTLADFLLAAHRSSFHLPRDIP